MRSALATLASGGGQPVDPYFKNTVLLLNGDGTEGGQNNIFVDSSNYSTVAPTAVASSYATFFDGASDYLTTPQISLGTGDFTVECWTYLRSRATSFPTIFGNYNAGGSGLFGIFAGHGSHNTSRYQVYVSSLAIESSIGIVYNDWTHIAAVRSSGVLKLYINGVEAGSFNTTANINGVGSNCSIGAPLDAPTNSINGYISNFRIVVGSAVYTGNFTPPRSTPLTAITGTQLLTCQNATFVDNSSNNFTVTTNGNVFNTNGFGTPSGVGPYAVYFDGSGDYLTVPASTAFAFGTGDFTVECWAYINSGTSNTRITNRLSGNAASGTWGFNFGPSGFSFTEVVVGEPGVVGSNLPGMTNKWLHLAASRSGTTLRLFVNGIKVGEGTNTTNFSNSSYQLAIGASYEAQLSGYLSNVRILKGTALYTADFSPPTSKLTAIANTQLLTCQDITFKDNSTNNFYVSPVGNPTIDLTSDMVPFSRFGNTTQGSFSPFNGPWSAYFDGVTDALEFSAAPQFNLSGNTWTIEVWLYPEALPGSGNNCRFFHFGTNGSAASWQFAFGSAGELFGSIELGGKNSVYAGAGTVEIHKWQHFALVLNNGAATIYKNGVSVATQPAMDLPSNTNMTLRIGYDTVGTVNFNYKGYMFDARISNGVAKYTSTFTPPTAPLTPDSSTGLLICNSKTFKDFGNARLVPTVAGNLSAARFTPFKDNIPILEETVGNSVFFDGSGDYLSVTGVSASGTGDFTYEAWIFPRSLPNNPLNIIFDHRTGGGHSTGMFMYVDNTGKLAIVNATASTNAITLNQWNHIAYVRSSGSLTYYINGVSGGSQSFTKNNTDTTFVIGASNDTFAYQWPGFISNVRYTKSAVYTSNFTPPTSKLTPITNTQLLTCQSDTLVDNSTNNYSVNFSGNVSITERSPFGNLSLKPNPRITTVGSAFFDGTGDWITTPNVNAYNLSSSEPFTIECWVYRIASNRYDGIIGARQNAQAQGWCLFIHDSNTFYLGSVIVGNSYANRQLNPTVIPTGSWTHLALVKDSTGYIGYVNGVPGAKIALTGGLDYQSSRPLIVGALGSEGELPFWGFISNLKITKGEALYTGPFLPSLSPAANTSKTTLLLNFNDASIVDLTRKHILETVGNTRILTSTKKYGSGAMYFDGSGDYFVVRDSHLFNFGTGDFTIEAWVRPNVVPPSGFYYSIIGQRDSFSSNHSFTLSLEPGGAPYAEITGSGSGSGTPYAFVRGTAVSANVWTHIAMCRKGGILRVFQNGILTGTNSNANFAVFDSPSTIKIGAFDSGPWANSYFNGYIDDFRVTRGFARYDTNFTPTGPYPTE